MPSNLTTVTLEDAQGHKTVVSVGAISDPVVKADVQRTIAARGLHVNGQIVKKV